ncbi:MAG: cytochrome-c oxidase [Parcubacteria group bacterium]|nr:cytochrome-c oxidase [Parcubacteria group bacterium]
MSRNIILTCVAAALILGLSGFAFLHSSSLALLNPSGIIGVHEKSVIILTVLLSGIIVVPVFLMLFSFAWKYRADDPEAIEHHAPEWDHDSWWTDELVWWVVPGVIVFLLSILAWQSAHTLDPYEALTSKEAPITVQVVALDWKWLFIYPAQGIATVNMLEIPENTPIHFEITADAPMNSFWIPKLGGQIMAMQGMTNQLNLEATGEGTYTGVSANISGAGFAGMTFPAKSVSKDEFDAWVQSHKSEAPLNADAYAALAKPSSYTPPAYYSLPNANLYTSIIMTYMMPANMQPAPIAMPAMNMASTSTTTP